MSKKLNMKAMKSFAKSNKVKLPKGDPKAAADVLMKYFEEKFEEDDLAMCHMCKFPSGPAEGDNALVSCPYCGVQFDDDEEEEEVEEEEVEETEEEEEEEEVEETEEEEELEEDDEEEEEKNEDVPMPHEEVEDEEDLEEDDELEGTFSDDEDGGGDSAGTDIVEKSPEKIEEGKKRTERIIELRRQSSVIAYDIGVELKEINEQALYKHTGHKDFKEYCEKELDYTRAMAYRYMSLTALDREDTLKLGVTKSHVVVSAPERERETLLDMAKNDATRKEMEDYLKKGKQSVPTENVTPKITLVGRVQEGEMFVPWTNDEGKATTVEDEEAVATVELVTGIMMSVSLNKDKGVTVSFSKDEPEVKEKPKVELKPAKKPAKKEEKKQIKPAKKSGGKKKNGKKTSKKK
jgi:hypothetical protein